MIEIIQFSSINNLCVISQKKKKKKLCVIHNKKKIVCN